MLEEKFISSLVNEVESKILKAIDDHVMLTKGDNLIVGVSGGADSMLLLHFLLSLAEPLNLKITVAHVNHCLRGAESDRDENFVCNFCNENNIDFKLLKVDVSTFAKQRHQGLEECGRNLRYEFFNSLVTTSGKIVVAHNLSDYVETVILNLARGSGVTGLMGIQAKRDNIIRPLIYLKKDEIISYCHKKNISYVEDSTNFLPDYTRNKIRLNIVPLLKEINPNFENAVLNMGSILRQDNDYLNLLAERALETSILEVSNAQMIGSDYKASNDGVGHNEKAIGHTSSSIKERQIKIKYDLARLSSLDDAIKTRCIKKMLSEVDKSLSVSYSKMKLILELMTNQSGAVNICKDIFIKAKNNQLEIFTSKHPSTYWETNFLKDNTVLTANSRRFIIKVVEKLEYDRLQKENREIALFALDYDKISDSCVLRNRREHDRFSPKNRNVSKTLKKFFNEQKIDESKRYDLALIAKDSTVFWIESIGSSEETKVTNKTKKVLIIKELLGA